MRGFYGNWELGSTVSLMWSTNDSSGASVTRSTDGSIKIYKGTSATERTSSSGIVDTEDFDSLTGVHLLTIDTSDVSDAGFYENGSIYHAVLSAATIDGQTVNHPIASFAIGQMVGANSEALSNASVVAIVNRALIMLGEDTITAIDEDTSPARKANAIYTSVRDSVLEMHTWKSARKMAVLAQLTTTPVGDFTYEYQLPSDFIRLVAIQDMASNRYQFQIQGRKLLTDESTMTIEYVAQITDPNDMSPLLKNTISAALAFELALPITGKNSIKDRAERTLQDLLASARHSDSTQRQDDQMSTETYLQSRGGGLDVYRPISST